MYIFHTQQTNTTMDTLQDAQVNFSSGDNSNHGGKDDPAILLIIQEVEDEISMQVRFFILKVLCIK